jgi:hypothetical protein
MPAWLYNAAYRVWPATFATIRPEHLTHPPTRTIPELETMANNFGDDGAANNGFGRRSLHQWEGRLLHATGYMAPPDFRAPGGWRLSAGGIPIPLPPTGSALDAAIDEVLETMSDEQHVDPCLYPDNQEAWTAFFRR